MTNQTRHSLLLFVVAAAIAGAFFHLGSDFFAAVPLILVAYVFAVAMAPWRNEVGPK